MNVCRVYTAHTHTFRCTHKHLGGCTLSHCRPLQVSSSSSLPPFLFFCAFFLLRASEGWVGGQAQAERRRDWGGGFSLPLFCCCWGERERERAHIHTETSLQPHSHPHTALPLLPPQTQRYNIKEPTLLKDYFSHTLAPQSGSVPLARIPPPPSRPAPLGTARAFLPSSFHTWRGSLSQAIADKLQTRLPPFPSLPPSLSFSFTPPFFFLVFSFFAPTPLCSHPVSPSSPSCLRPSFLPAPLSPLSLRMWGPH